MVFLLQIAVLALLLVAGASSDNSYYSIWPVSSGDDSTNTKITDDLNSRIDSSKIWVSKSKYLGNMYWYAPLSDDDKAHYSNFPGVRYVAVPGQPVKDSSHFRALDKTLPRKKAYTKRELKSDKPAVDQLKLVSQADGQKFKDLDGYYYDNTSGRQTKIYIIDSGLEASHDEFSDLNVDWIHSGPFPGGEETDVDPKRSHGTCMASCATGYKDGVVKLAMLTMVKADTDTGNNIETARERYIDALAMTYDDAKDHNPGGKAVVSMSWGLYHANDPVYDDCVRDTFQYLIQSLIDTDVQCLAATGDSDYKDTEVVTWPALLGDKLVPDLIVVGGMDITSSGRADGFRDSDFVKIYAPAEDVECAVKDNKYELDAGTSQATASTAGLVAYFMTLGHSGADARKLLYSLAYPRDPKKNGPPTIWNGVDIGSTG